MIRIGSLFSGIGGLELGLERGIPGASTAWQVEIDPFCLRVLAKHWPSATRMTDVRSVGAANLAPVDLICGGFPCQDVSSAGARKGLSGARSGLWYEYLRIVGELRPRIVVVERGVADRASHWSAAPVFRRVDDGVSGRVDRSRLKALGNAVVPQCAEVIGRIIAEAFRPEDTLTSQNPALPSPPLVGAGPERTP